MTEFINTADTLRMVKKAEQRFLALWALECMLQEKQVWRRLSADIAAAGTPGGSSARDPREPMCE